MMSSSLATDAVAIGWREEALERLCESPQYGYTASSSESGNVRFLRISDITDSGVTWSTVPLCECPTDLLSKYRLASGDIVFARIGATTGKSYLINDPPLSVFASYLIRIRARDQIDPGFLSHFFKSSRYWQQINAQKNANLKKGVSGSLLKTLLVPVPPLDEQRKIASVLGLVQRAIKQYERLIALTQELKKSLMHKLFTEGLRGERQKQTEIGPVPESWEVVKLKDICEFMSGAHHRNETISSGSVQFHGSPLKI
jgi:type I restriction enzyme S subunit